MAPRPKERSLTGESYWAVLPRENFTKRIEKLWADRLEQIPMAGVAMKAAEKHGTL